MTCQPERVTGLVDGALDAPLAAEVEAHVALCETCRDQAAAERAVRARLLSLLHPPLPTGLEPRVRRTLAARRRLPIFSLRVLLPLAAAVALAFVWLRQRPPAVAWEMARDHDHCFGMQALPAQVMAEDAESVMRWFEGQGTRVPVVPDRAAGFGLVGARYCPFPDFSRAAHIYYRKDDRKAVSLFVLPRTLSSDGASLHVTRDHVVRVMRVGTLTVGIVADQKDDVDAFSQLFETTVASN